MPRQDPAVTPELVASHGLKPDEYQRILDLIGRVPTFTELGIFSAMWNEHCSYKSSRLHLRALPTKAPWVIQGPGENAGVIDIGDGEACVFKMESHNHPSYIEPFQGAATGVGGILRDVFTMGARPVACLNLLRFGAPEHPKTRHLVSGVVAGIGSYGNSFGVPTVGGATAFHMGYDGNILVNAMAVGIARADEIFYAKATGIGNPIVYLGSKTGRDGIHGATMASAAFEEDAEAKRPTVQVGDPFTEKLLLEACLELMRTGAVIAIQDMGAAGLTSSAVEMGAKGDLGIELDLDAVPCRETGMSAYEMLLSESQERMLMVLDPQKEAEAKAVFVKWGLDFAIIGKTTDTLRFVVKHEGEVKADLPIKQLGDAAPLYDRPHIASPALEKIEAAAIEPPLSNAGALALLLATPDLCSKRWIYEQYDHLILGNSVETPGGDAAVIRLGDGPKGLALTTDVTPRYCEADPVAGGRQAVAEAWRNLTAVGALPRAVTDNLNFGNPEKPEIMGQFVGCLTGIGEACRALDFPIVSGNVSLYNESSGKGIPPTPSIGGVGVIADVGLAAKLAFRRAGDAILLIGDTEGWLGQSLYLRDVCGREAGAPPPVDLAAEKRNGDFVRELIRAALVSAVHDISDGGLAVALAEMAMAGGVGASVEAPANVPAHGFWFGEDQSRYIVATSPERALGVLAAAQRAGVPCRRIGETGGAALTLKGEAAILIADLSARFEGWLPDYMAAAL
ncbi:phosphoribosylformylglycinamidine synthase II [Methylocella silvestris BL2]|uniref:Phosphoribosylformylglycinamidine synthase subunit PurL n=1 Tax=Methylocella silvestris (strain DSM 15510 / CIP 108128 / LMG 27833 / NCIMB 13906 / BL2) TaxID=395965 RepID=PURL_METSB|nr:phosphoribosylformylglycinamidine synthase subunit PurL [Methylocella silvestris]B8EPE8.1 RecName: Full=Phosphoribosylformylglycinamidine synthase subunit PurL; Short=FGAM synthase; AltName: Full=Formylglycinamide ribonucleotide amidotransferase subunit II; Short=FGAR amidotransferase II; Short=FGAR-AT II; AltName: Full=Glutamine amidotransferase PurL; AltName: Full=Phosphoribosylformylglycinamidine synthase subunit II [Methylocella silvestris BL2]ACK50153.1 phosphoribosylformylglycinamidine s